MIIIITKTFIIIIIASITVINFWIIIIYIIIIIIVVIIWNKYPDQSRSARMPRDTLPQAVKQCYGVSCLTGHVFTEE